MRLGKGLAIALGLGFAYGCGSSPADDCGKLVEAFARAWERCGRGTYDSAKKNFSTALPCNQVKDSNADQVDQCVNDLNALNGAACDSVKTNGTFPASCTGALQK
jgi:hypothetical protein